MPVRKFPLPEFVSENVEPKILPPFELLEELPVLVPVKVPLKVLQFRYNDDAVQFMLPLKVVPEPNVSVDVPLKLRFTSVLAF